MISAPLKQVGPSIWQQQQPFSMHGIKIPVRTTLIQLDTGRLWLHAPGPHVDGLAQIVSQWGSIQDIVAPNAFHHLYLNRAHELFPEAVIWGPGAVEKKQTHLSLKRLNDKKPSPWYPHIEALNLAGTDFQEYAFYHPLSRSLIVSDLVFNLKPQDLMTRFATSVMGTNGKIACSRLLTKVLLKDKKALRQSIEQLLNWDFQRILMAHGDIIEDNARPEFIKALNWLL